jgi:hypothetical protein
MGGGSLIKVLLIDGIINQGTSVLIDGTFHLYMKIHCVIGITVPPYTQNTVTSIFYLQ